MEMSSGCGTKAVGGRLAAESPQAVDACLVTNLWQLNRATHRELISGRKTAHINAFILEMFGQARPMMHAGLICEAELV